MIKALFLDRDGVINIEKDYLYKIDDFEFIDGIIELCRYFLSNNYKIFVVTNQSGIARGYYSEKDFLYLTRWMIEKFHSFGITIEKVYYCPHHPDITGFCECRKPKPGMLYQAKNEFHIDMSNSIMIGDKERDIEAAQNAGVQLTYLFDSLQQTEISSATRIVTQLNEIMEYEC